MTRRGASWRACRFPAGFALIVHRIAGAILFDTGYAPRFDAATRSFPERLYRWFTPVSVDATQSAASQLSRLGVAAEDVATIVVSHFHADHVAGLRDFPNATVVCAREAWTGVTARGRVASLRLGFLHDLMPDDIDARLSFAEERAAFALSGPYRAFGTGRDLFGDGSIVVVPLPGHARGHVGVLLPVTPDGATFFIGDAAWSHAGYARSAPPPFATTAFLGDTAEYRRTLRNIGVLSRADPFVRIVPAHASDVAELPL